AVLEELHVPGEEEPPLVHRASHQLGIVGPRVVSGVEAQQSQVAGQAPEVDIGDESRLAQGPGPEPDEGRDVEGLEHGIDADALAAGEAMREIDRLAVDEYEVDFCVRHSAGLDQVLDGGRELE